MFKVTEAFTEGKYGADFPTQNDDRIVELPDFIAVFDGVTGPQGAAAAQCAVDALHKLPKEATEREYARAVTHAMMAEFGPILIAEKMPACTAVVLSLQRRELWFYGDARAVLIGRDHHELLERTEGFEWTNAMDEVRAIHNTLMLRTGELASADALYEQDPGRDMLAPVGLRQHAFANVAGSNGYTVLCARMVPDEMSMVVPIPDDLEMLVLMSDGYPVHLMAREDFLSLANIEAKLAEVNAIDPHCMGVNHGPKGVMRNSVTGLMNASYDDRSYVRVEIQR